MKISFRLLNLYQSTEDVVKVFTRLLNEVESIKTMDMHKSILIGSYIKPFINSRGDPSVQQGDPILTFILDVLYPKTLDVIAETSPHIIEMT